jgi:hypothetical protein
MRIFIIAAFAACIVLPTCPDVRAQAADPFQSVVPHRPAPRKPPRPRHVTPSQQDDDSQDTASNGPAGGQPTLTFAPMAMTAPPPAPTAQPPLPAAPLPPATIATASAPAGAAAAPVAPTPAAVPPAASPAQSDAALPAKAALASSSVAPPASSPAVSGAVTPPPSLPAPAASPVSLALPTTAPPVAPAPLAPVPVSLTTAPGLPPPAPALPPADPDQPSRHYYAFSLPAPYCDDSGTANGTCTTLVGIDRYEPGAQTWYVRSTSLTESYRGFTATNPWHAISVKCEATADGSLCKTRMPFGRLKDASTMKFHFTQGATRPVWEYSQRSDEFTIEGIETDVTKFTSMPLSN